MNEIRIRQATKKGYIEVPTGGGIRCELYDQQDEERKIPERALPDADRRRTGDILL